MNARQPVVFVGHGSPMNAIRSNDFTAALGDLGRALAATPPRAILVVSAHWQTHGTRVVTLETPRTIHDFGGFPRALFEVAYPAPGAPTVAAEIQALAPGIEGDDAWGLDHGAWSVLRHMFPRADVPVLQLSLNLNAGPRAHFEVARSMRSLSERGVLILASGNVTHNLRQIDPDEDAAPADWAVEFDRLTRDALVNGDLTQLFGERTGQGALWRTAHPSPEHYLPLLYAAGAARDGAEVSFPVEGFQHGTLSTRAVLYR